MVVHNFEHVRSDTNGSRYRGHRRNVRFVDPNPVQRLAARKGGATSSPLLLK